MSKQEKRREARDVAFQILFERTFSDASVEEIIDLAGVSREIIPEQYTIKTAEGVASRQDELDAIISKYSIKRSIARLSRVVLSVLRLAIYEIKFEDSVETSVAINEAVELAKKYAGDEEGGFVNGVLGAFARDIEKSPENTEGDA